MAKGKTTIFGLFAMICAVNFIGLVALVGSMFGFGIISKATFKDMVYVFRGTHVTLTENEYDYNTRLYRLVTDSSGKYVKKISATGASIPISVPTGKFFDYKREGVY